MSQRFYLMMKLEVIHDRFPIGIIEPLTEKEYFVRGCTALLDAVGAGIDKMDNVQKHLPEQHRAGKVIFVITTDGLENSSTEYSYEQIRRKIEAKKECRLGVFIFRSQHGCRKGGRGK